MTAHYKYRFDSTPPKPIHKRLRMLFACWLTMAVEGMSLEDAEDASCYALESPAILPAGSTETERNYMTAGWQRTLTILARMSVLLREAQP